MAAKEGSGITVVTSDRELTGRCRVHGAVVLSSEEFGSRLLEVALGLPATGEGGDDGWDFTTKKRGPGQAPAQGPAQERPDAKGGYSCQPGYFMRPE